MVRRPTQSICVSSVTTKNLSAKGDAPLDEVAVVCSCGEEGASWNVMENTGKRPVHTRDVGVLLA